MITGKHQRRREEIDRGRGAPGHEEVMQIIRSGAEGGCERCDPPLNVSMITMRPPQ
jgi:hypothetical protein